MMSKRIIEIIIIFILVLTVLFWCGSVLKCEVQTRKHITEFEENQLIQTIKQTRGTLKILSYSEESAFLYYRDIADKNVIEFKKQNEEWVPINVIYKWSISDSGETTSEKLKLFAQSLVWPYLLY